MAAIDAAPMTGTTARRWPPAPVVIYILAVVLPIYVNLGGLVMTSVRVFLLAMVLPLAFRLLSGRCGRLMVIDALMVAHILWATVALAVNNPNQVVQQAGSVGIEFIGGYLVGRACIRSREDFIALSRFLVLTVLCFLPFTLFETLTGRSLVLEVLNKLPGFSAQRVVYTEMRMGLHRVQSTFAHPIHFGLFCSVTLSLCYVALKGAVPDARRILAAMLIALSGFLALSSGALLAIFLQIGLFAWAFMFRRISWRWWLLVGLFALAYVVIDLLSNRSPIKVFMTYATFSAHTAYWRMIILEWGLKNVWANPLFGIGLNDWVRPYYMYSGSMDNFWLVMAVRYGIPGFLFLAVGYLMGLFRVMARDFSTDPGLDNVRRAWVFTFVGLTFTLITVHVWGNLYSFVFFIFGTGMWMIHAVPGGETLPAATVPEKEARALRLRRQDAAEPAYTRFPGGAAPAMRAAAAPVTTRPKAPPATVRPSAPAASRPLDDLPASRFAPQNRS